MKVLGIETSCDETAVAVLDVTKSKITVLSNIVSSQVKLHAKYGGVVPNLAAREHVKNIKHVFKLAMEQSGAPVRHSVSNIDLIAVTHGPGLGPALLVGIAFARTLAWKYNKPLVGVNHLEGHIYSNFLKKVRVNSTLRSFSGLRSRDFGGVGSEVGPILNLIVSGGHTELVLMTSYGKHELIGETLDDAIGEAFDKVARLLDLGYPGGPAISRIAERGDVSRFILPRPMLHSKDFNFSYSGLKTAVLYLIRDLKEKKVKIDSQTKADIAAAFQVAATEVLIRKTVGAARKYKVKSVFLSGGVSANKSLRAALAKAVKELGINYSQPELEYTGDNAAMIALAGYINKFKILRLRQGGAESRQNSKLKNPPSHKASEGTVKNSWKSVEMDANLGF